MRERKLIPTLLVRSLKCSIPMREQVVVNRDEGKVKKGGVGNTGSETILVGRALVRYCNIRLAR
jgi:hypothetical protein